MKEKDGRVLSRREFAQRAAILSASATLVSAETVFSANSKETAPQETSASSKLSEAGKAEADSRYQQIVALYGSRFDQIQRADLKRMCVELQPSLENIRKYALQNGDAPALYLKPLVEREKKPQATASPASKRP